MIDINELRRLAQAATPGPWHAAKSVETNSWAVWSDTTRLMELRPTKTVDMYRVSTTAAFIAAANPAAITELLDRLEAAESALSNLGVTPEEAKEALARHKATLARLEAAEKERDELRADKEALEREAVRLVEQADSVAADLVSAWKERDALRAKIEQMEQQEPYSYIYEYSNPIDGSPVWRNVPCYWNAQFPKSSKPLYALPVTQPAPDVFRGLVDEIVKEADDYERRTGDRVVGWIEKARAALNAAPKPEGE